MPADPQYRITGAILTPRPGGSVWTLTFTPEAPVAGAAFDPDSGREIVVTLSPADVDNLLFDALYSKREIEAIGGNP